MSGKPKHFSQAMIVLGGVALSLTLVRCSPISLSESKLRAAQGNGTPNVTRPGTVKPIGGAAVNPTEQASALTAIQASVQELSEYQIEISTLPPEQRLTIDADSPGDALAAFRSTRSVIIHFGGHSPDHCKAYLGLTMPETMIANYGWDNTFNPIMTDCTPLEEGYWKISVSSSVSLDTWTLLSPSLVGVTILAGNNPQMSVVGSGSSQPGGPNNHGSGGVHITPEK
jgi:hypothetical protein